MRARLVITTLGVLLLLLLSYELTPSFARAEPGPNTQPSTSEERVVPASRFVPTLGLGFGAFSETLGLKIDGREQTEARQDLFMAPYLGLWHPLGDLHASSLTLQGHVAIGLGAGFHSGEGRVLMREDVTVVYQAAKWCALHAGLGAGFSMNTAHVARSQAELRLVLSATLFGVVELGYLPYFSLPLGDEQRAVFGGTREIAASLAFVPIDFVLRGRFRSLSW